MIIFVFKSIHQKCTNDMNCKKTIYQYAIILNVKKIDRCIDSIYELKPFTVNIISIIFLCSFLYKKIKLLMIMNYNE